MTSRSLPQKTPLPDCMTCREAEPLLRWWPELEIPGHGLVHNVAALGEDDYYLLEFPDEDLPLNPPALRLRMRRIFVREAWFADENESLGAYVRRQAAAWQRETDGGA